MNDLIAIFRHFLATLAFRLNRVTDGAPEGFGDFDAGSGVRTPLEIMQHMCRLMYFTQHILVSAEMPSMEKATWQEEIINFRQRLEDLDTLLQSMETPERNVLLKALQGPLSDAMTHIGQLATLRRMAGSPIEGISYVKADIQVGVF